MPDQNIPDPHISVRGSRQSTPANLLDAVSKWAPPGLKNLGASILALYSRRLMSRDGKAYSADELQTSASTVIRAAESMTAAQEAAMRSAIGAENSVPELFHDFTADANGTVYQDGTAPIIGTAFQMIGDQATAVVGNTTTESAVAAGGFSAGEKYIITSAGTTNFTLIGASASTVGTIFTATGIGSGTGTATPWRPALLPAAGTLYYLDCTLSGKVRNFAVEYVHKAISGGTGVTQSAVVLGISQAGVIASNLIHIRLVRNAVYVETGSPGSFSSIYTWVLNNNRALPVMPLGVATVSRIEIHDDTLLIFHEGRVHTVKHADIASYNGSHVFVENTADGTVMNAQVGVLRLWGNAPDGFFPVDSALESYIHGAPKSTGRAWFGTGEFTWLTGSTPTQADDYGVATPGAMLTNKGFWTYPFASTAAYPAEMSINLVTAVVSSVAGDSTTNRLALFDFNVVTAGQGWEYVVRGTFGANGNSKTIQVWNATEGAEILNSGALTENGTSWELRVGRNRLSAASHSYYATLLTGGGVQVLGNMQKNYGSTSSTIQIRVTTPTATGDILIHSARGTLFFK